MKEGSSLKDAFGVREKPIPGLLVKAVERGDIAAVKALLDQGSDANEENKFWVPVLQWAIFNRKSQEIAYLLIDGGADVNRQDKSGNTALMKAVWEAHPGIVNKIMENNANLDTRNNLGDTALIVAAKYIHARARLDDETDPGGNRLFYSGEALIIAESIMRQLTRSGAGIHITNNTGKTALTILTEAGHPEIAQALIVEEKNRIQHAASVSKQDLLRNAPQSRRIKIRPS